MKGRLRQGGAEGPAALVCVAASLYATTIVLIMKLGMQKPFPTHAQGKKTPEQSQFTGGIQAEAPTV